jgi:hypothetical protein
MLTRHPLAALLEAARILAEQNGGCEAGNRRAVVMPLYFVALHLLQPGKL